MLELDAPTQLVIGTTPAALSYVRSGSYNLKAICPGQVIYLGTSSSVTTSNGWPLEHGDFYAPECDDLSVIWAVASADGCRLAVQGYTEY